MKKLLLLSALLIFACSSDDDSEDNPLPAYTIEGKWLIEGTVPAGNTMYLYEDGVRYTYYCVEGDCNALYNSMKLMMEIIYQQPILTHLKIMF